MRRSSTASQVLGPLLVALLLLGGCTTVGGSGHEAGLRAASTTTSAPPSPTPAPPRPSSSPSAGAVPLPSVPQPSVPQHRATLRPVTGDRPAPTRFAAPSIGVALPVVPLGVGPDGRMQLPETNREVAWYEYSSRPGDPEGTTVLAAHVDTRAEGLGPFARLRELRRGDDLTVTDASGRDRRYTVTGVDDVRKSDVALDQLFRRDGTPALRVLTCGGPFSRATGYRDNIVVSASPA